MTKVLEAKETAHSLILNCLQYSTVHTNILLFLFLHVYAMNYNTKKTWKHFMLLETAETYTKFESTYR